MSRICPRGQINCTSPRGFSKVDGHCHRPRSSRCTACDCHRKGESSASNLAPDCPRPHLSLWARMSDVCGARSREGHRAFRAQEGSSFLWADHEVQSSGSSWLRGVPHYRSATASGPATGAARIISGTSRLGEHRVVYAPIAGHLPGLHAIGMNGALGFFRVLFADAPVFKQLRARRLNFT